MKAERNFRKATHTRSAELADQQMGIVARHSRVRTIHLTPGILNTHGHKVFTNLYSGG